MNFRRIHTIGFFVLGLSAFGSLLAQPSVLSQGNWFKIEVEKTGVYRLDYNQLKNAGVDVVNLNPKTLKIVGNPGGMLPQANATYRPYDLIENAIVVQGEEDGAFGSNDFILFFAQGADKQSYNATKQVFFYEHNLYADKNYVFLTYGNGNGRRVQTAAQELGGVMVNEFEDVYHYEKTTSNLLHSGREWYGERFESGADRSFSIPLEGIKEGSVVKIISDVVAASITGSKFTLSFNGHPVPEQIVPNILNTQYGIKAYHKRDTFLLNATDVGSVGKVTHELKYAFVKSGSSSATGYLDYFNVTATRKLAVYGNQTMFRSGRSLQHAVTQFNIENSNTTTQVWDVTDTKDPIRLSVQLNNAVASITTSTNVLKEFVAFNQTLSTGSVKKIDNQDLHGISASGMVIVTDDELKPEAERLASHRQSHSGMSVQVVTVNQIFNEFSSGRPDVTAIRDFARHIKNLYPIEFKYLLMFGKGTYDYKNALKDNVNRVFTYESRNSTAPLSTYSSDDYFGLLSDNEGAWEECFSCNETLDIGVGRLPVKTVAQASNVVDKIIDYDTNLHKRGKWQTHVTFVADDGDSNTHQQQADFLGEDVEAGASVFSARKIYVDMYEQISRPAGQIAPEVNNAIKNALEDGTLILNYTGHGNEYQWANEKILDELLIAGTDNTIPPFLVTATCEFGRHDDPVVTSVAEIALLRKSHGVIGLVTTARPVNSSTNFDLNEAFYQAMLTKSNGRFQTLGDIFKTTKNNSASGVANRNFSLLGDPSMTLAFPDQEIEVELITTNEQSDTLRALSSVHIEGIVKRTSGELDEDFNGTLHASVYDKAVSYRTLGNENPAFNFKQWSSLLFQGEATVENGRFSFDFIVPKNIAYSVGNGRFSLFASSPTSTAAGAGTVKVGGASDSPGVDNQSPVVTAFMNDTTFVNGGTVSPNAKLVVRLSDASGISISGMGIGNNLLAVLDNDADSYELRNYYVADADDFTKGTVVFPLHDLPPGKHRIRVMAWDTHNNPGEGYVDFVVTTGNEMKVEDFGNFPNPFSQSTTLFFTHNKAGEDLEAELVIYDSRGEELRKELVSIDASTFQVNLTTFDRNDLPGGIYVARLFLRSLSSEGRAQSQAKLIIVN